MAEPYKFQYDGHTVEYSRGTVRTGIESTRMIRKLLRAYDYIGDNIAPDDLYDNIDEYSAAMSRSKTDAAWWAHSNMSDEELREKFECFLDQPEDLYIAFRAANRAVSMPKKTPTSP